MLMLNRSSIIALILLAAATAWAQSEGKLNLRAAVFKPGGSIVTVGFTKPRPDQTRIGDPDLWVIVAKTPSDPVGRRIKVNTAEPFATYKLDGQITLTLESAPSADTSSIDVTFLLDGQPRTTWQPNERARSNPAKPSRPCFQGLGFKPASNRNKADGYLSGIWIPAEGARPTYSIDSNLTVPLCSTTFWDLLRLDGKVKSNDRPNADPDSFSAGISMGRKYPFHPAHRQYLDFQWGVAKWEFSRRQETFNFTSAPTATWALQLGKGVDIEVPLGLEVGTNLRNRITALRNGYGGIARVVPQANFYAVTPELWRHTQLTWTTTYAARILLTPEPSIDYRRNPVVSMAQGTRHHVANSLDFKLNEFVGLTIKHEYGSLPPAFEFVNNKATVGLIVMWSWKK